MGRQIIRIGLGLLALVVITAGIIQVFDFENRNQKTLETHYMEYPKVDTVSRTILVFEEAFSELFDNRGDVSAPRTEKLADVRIEHRDEVQQFKVLVNRRGASSFFFEKPQVSLSVVNDEGMQVEHVVMDMPKGEDWVLNGPFIDRSMMRNYLAYSSAFEVMGYAPRLQFTELYVKINNEAPQYLGLYAWTEKIRRGPYRVGINASVKGNKETSFIAAKDRYREGDHLMKVYGKELNMYAYERICIYPKTTLTLNQLDYIGDTVTAFERILYHDKYSLLSQGYETAIDTDTFIDYYILNEFFMNTDAGLVSTFYYKDVRGKMRMGPVWDFNNGLGNVNTLFEKGEYRGLFMHECAWFDRLSTDRRFVEKLVKRYHALRRGVLNTGRLLRQIDETAKVLDQYVDADRNLYDSESVVQAMYFFLQGEDPALVDHLNAIEPVADSYERELDLLKEFIILRGGWLDKHFDSLLLWTE